MSVIKLLKLGLLSLVLTASGWAQAGGKGKTERIGVLYAVHGGAATWGPQASWDSAAQIFSYDPNSFVYRNVIWNPGFWPFMLFEESGQAQSMKYDFEYARIGGTDPYDAITDAQLEDMTNTLNVIAFWHNLFNKNDVQFITDRMSWISDDPADLPNPRGIYNPQVTGGAPLTYCGSFMDGGPWPGCDPERFNVDGAVERMLTNDIDRLVIVDTTTTGVRFFKTFDQLSATRTVVDAYNAANGTDITIEWVNDPTDLMTESYPVEPAGWTASLGAPTLDSAVPLAGRPNPFVEDPLLAWLYVQGVNATMRADIPYSEQAVVLMNHHVRADQQFFDPKIDDTLILNEQIRDALQIRFPGLQEQNILGAWLGRKDVNPNIIPAPPTFSQLERTRAMRGESLGEAYLYETDAVLPDGLDGHLYWDALEILKDRGIKHIVIAFPQIFSDAVLSLVEIPNQIAKEVGYKNWLYWNDKDYDTYPAVGHPFADYWGNWADTQCRLPGSLDDSVTEPCCFAMGGCPATAQPYPPERQSLATKPISALDPHLAYAVSEFGHLGYDPAQGPVDADAPVQSQYTGTWAMWEPPSDNPLAGAYIARKVWQQVR